MSGEKQAGLEAILGGHVSRETFNRLLVFEAEFTRWASKINLVAPSTLSNLWKRHILDSAQLLRFEPEATSWLDFGSGGGFPGAVLAILLMDRDGASIRLVESNKKKSAFLSTILGTVGAPASVDQVRVEETAARGETFEIITARAVADLDRLFSLSVPWLSNGATGLFHKGRDYRREIEESRDGWRFDLVEHRSLVDPESVILAVRNLRRKPRI